MALSRHDQTLPVVDAPLMSVADDFAGVVPFQTRRPLQQSVPFIFNSPHSGRSYPERFLALSRLDGQAIRRSEDCYVEELFAAAVTFGAPLLSANFPRAYLDVNREPWELDPRMFSETLPSYANIRSPRVAGGLGTVPRIVGEGQEIYAGKLPFGEARQRVEAFYKPYHACLGRLLAETQAAFGLAVLIDCHSMPASIRVGEAGLRPDFIIGDRFNTSASAALSEAAIGILVSLGYTVAHNKPYAGGFITEHYGRPARGLHALQIEVNRGLYMNERSYRKSRGFLPLADDMARFVERLIAAAGFGKPAMPLAAE
ncbi:MAG: N-formylglutamate amidohydrolase [Nitratireductor sp.]